MSYLGFYLLTKLDDFRVFLYIATAVEIVFAFVFILAILGSYAECTFDSDDFKPITKNKNKILSIYIVTILLTFLMPSSKQAAFIIIAPELVENGAVKETFKNIPELTQLGTEYLKETLKEKLNERN